MISAEKALLFLIMRLSEFIPSVKVTCRWFDLTFYISSAPQWSQVQPQLLPKVGELGLTTPHIKGKFRINGQM